MTITFESIFKLRSEKNKKKSYDWFWMDAEQQEEHEFNKIIYIKKFETSHFSKWLMVSCCYLT